MNPYWLIFAEEQTNPDKPTITAISPIYADRQRLGHDACIVLAAADIYRDEHPTDTVVFLAEITHWLAARHDLTWPILHVDLDAAINDIVERIDAIEVDVSPLTLVIVATGGHGLDPSISTHVAPVRRAMEAARRAHAASTLWQSG